MLITPGHAKSLQSVAVTNAPSMRDYHNLSFHNINQILLKSQTRLQINP